MKLIRRPGTIGEEQRHLAAAPLDDLRQRRGAARACRRPSSKAVAVRPLRGTGARPTVAAGRRRGYGPTRTVAAFDDPDILARHEWWQENINGRLPQLLDELLACDIYGSGNGTTSPPNAYGVYLFTSRERHEYVGRTGITERTRLSGGKSYSGFRHRLKGHLTATHTSGSWRYKRTCASHREAGYPLAVSRKANCGDPAFKKAFVAEIEVIRAMEFRFVAIESELLSAVFEMYSATVLNTPWNSFPTS